MLRGHLLALLVKDRRDHSPVLSQLLVLLCERFNVVVTFEVVKCRWNRQKGQKTDG